MFLVIRKTAAIERTNFYLKGYNKKCFEIFQDLHDFFAFSKRGLERVWAWVGGVS
jgi:hypothetical protein